jgi:hypothetical protein
MLADIERIVRLQGLDLRAAELRKEIATLPKLIAEIEKALESHKRKLEADQAVLVSNQKERKRIEGEVQMQQQKISKYRDQMASAKTNEQFRAFQKEIDFCEQEIRKFEDRTLELMDQSESLGANVKLAETALAKEKAVVDKRKAEARERTGVDQAALNTITAERAALCAEIAPALLGQYERLSRKFPTGAISDATKGRCSACRLEIRPQLFQDIRKREKLFVCENCGRMLHYNPPVVVDPELGGPVPAGGGTRVDMS